MTVDRRPARIQLSQSPIDQASTPFARSERIRTSEDVRAAINPYDAEYHRLLRHILEFGSSSGDRTGTGTKKEFGYQMRFDLSKGNIPLITTKNTWWNGIEKELLWFLQGGTNIKFLKDNKVNIWNEWADENGELGPVYGAQWVAWQGDAGPINQIQQVQQSIHENPNSRRHIVSAWNVAKIDQMALPPCHLLFQFQVSDDKLNCQLYQRSGDVFLGVPFNIASYSLLTVMMAQTTGLKPGTFVHTLGDVHVYNNHREQVNTQLSRPSFSPPQIEMDRSVTDIFDFRSEHYRVVNYQHHPTIPAPIAV